jgi:peptidoglycan/LPS O-acetylase OafA/YrhL
MQLTQAAIGRDNNYNLIRMLAAVAVMVSHSYALSTGRPETQPLQASLGMDIGNMAVDVFFIASGFLVTASLMTRRNALDFLLARLLRIYPALIVVVMLTVFGLGAVMTTLPLADYFSHSRTYLYLAKSSTLIWGVAYLLPGVFEDNPYRGAVNGSLWTLPFEIRMYAYLVIAWTVLLLVKPRQSQFFRFAVVASCLIAGVLVLREHFILEKQSKGLHLFFMFFTGAAFQLFKDRVRLNHAAFALALAALVVAGIVDRHLFFAIYIATAAYLLFYLAYVPAGRLRAYNRVGDYSYGYYIYAFPIQQTLAAAVPGISVLGMVLSAGLATLLCAILSWHLVERRALAAKDGCAAATRRALRLAPAQPSAR